MSGYLSNLADVCRAAGVTVIEEPGWQTRGRGGGHGKYASGRPTHVMWHHTASNTSARNDVNYICYGNQYAPSPLSNLYLARNGDMWVLAAGPSNTNGSGHDSWGGGVPNDSMNEYAIGIEMANRGDGSEAWPKVQQDAAIAVGAQLHAAYGFPAGHSRAHFEWSPGRKIDPYGSCRWNGQAATFWNMDAFRSELASAGTGPEPLPPQPPRPRPEGDDMERYCGRDKAGTVWVGDGVSRRGLSSWDTWCLMVLQSNLGSGAKLILAKDNGPAITDPNQINSLVMTPEQLDSLGKSV